MSNRVNLKTLGGVFAVLLLAGLPLEAAAPFNFDFNLVNGLLTNEYAFWSPTLVGVRLSPHWDVQSGSLFIQNNTGWTGVPDAISPNLLSTNGNNSAIFRMVTHRNDFQNVSVSFSLINQGLTSTSVTPATDWDGCHVWLRYQSEEHLYYASVNRRDNRIIVKKKVPGGPSNGGTYYDLSSYVAYRVPLNTWQTVRATISTLANGSVQIQLFINGTLRITAIDDGSVGGAPIRAAGRVGIRGDNANLRFDNFAVADLVTTSPPPPAPSNPCDLNASGSVNVTDVQLCTNQALGTTACTTGDLNRDGRCNIVDLQRVINAALSGTCAP